MLAAFLAARVVREVQAAQVRWLARRLVPVAGALPSGVVAIVGYRSSRPRTASEIGSLAAASAASLRCGDKLGSGFFVTPTRVVTNAHVVCGELDEIEIVLADGRSFTGLPVDIDWRVDLALVSAAGADARPLELGDAAITRRGDGVYFFGSPRGLDFTLAQAIVSHEGRSHRGISYLQIDGSVNPGNSGGSLLNERGEVVGIVTMMVGEASGLGLALPVNYVFTRHGDWLLPMARELDEETWNQRLRNAEATDKAEVEELIAGLRRTALESARVRDGRTIDALMLRYAESPPPVEPVRSQFEIVGGGSSCRPWGVGTWMPLGEVDSNMVDPSTRAWLTGHRLASGFWAVPYEVRLPRECPSAPSLEGSLIGFPSKMDEAVPIEL